SLVHATLSTHPIFVEMDFQTRNQYRNAIEELSKGSSATELDIGRMVLDASIGPAGESQDRGRLEPGYFLLGRGRQDIEARIGFRPRPREAFRRSVVSAGLAGYLGAICALTLGWSFATYWVAAMIMGEWPGVLLLLLAVLPASEAAVALVNFIVTKITGARLLPALELRNGIPEHLRTLVVVPTLLNSREGVDEEIERLEVHYLTEPQGDVYFGLLTDWTDSETEQNAGDEALLQAALEGISALNERYGGVESRPRFLLLHRRRIWNEAESRWMGWERKRGKLHELNLLLRGATDTSFAVMCGRLPENVRYVLTLDADTRMLRDTARRLAGKLAHPLNRPEFDKAAGRVVGGYGILQPRVTPSLPDRDERSIYQRIFSTPRGLDPYVFAVSDVYQDLFGEGSFTGKGIYDVDAFEDALKGRIPENALLSHDLFEGIFARSGFVSDIEVIEDFPTRYEVAAARQHRWIRGDWQLLPWLIAPRRSGRGDRQRDRIPPLGCWKMFDNLRRSLMAPACVAALIAGFALLPAAASTVWAISVLLAFSLPSLIPVFDSIVPRHVKITLSSHVRSLFQDFARALSQIGLNIAFLGHQAWMSGDALVRTLYRLAVSRHHLLEWMSAAQVQRTPQLTLAGYYGRMWGS
ncbi:MAG: glycosyl transferase, partial [Aestuariivirgaceae bacterium]